MMATRYFVTAVMDCPECGGSGHVQHPAWATLRAAVDVSSMREKQIEKWFAGMGFERIPDEEYRCPECDGAGAFEKQAPLGGVYDAEKGELLPIDYTFEDDELEGVYDCRTNGERIAALEERVAELEANTGLRIEHLAANDGASLIVAEEVDPLEALEAAYYDENHMMWERDEWQSRAEAYEAKLMAKSGASLILRERERQIDEEWYSPEHDDRYTKGQLYIAAECYACLDDYLEAPDLWPWDKKLWKPKDRISNLVRAGALLAAEIDRLLRLEGAVSDGR